MKFWIIDFYSKTDKGGGGGGRREGYGNFENKIFPLSRITLPLQCLLKCL